MDDKRIRRLFLEHVQELADVDSLQVYNLQNTIVNIYVEL